MSSVCSPTKDDVASDESVGLRAMPRFDIDEKELE